MLNCGAIACGDDTEEVRFYAAKRAMLVQCRRFHGGQPSCRQYLQHNVNTLFGGANKRGKLTPSRSSASLNQACSSCREDHAAAIAVRSRPFNLCS